MHSGLPTLDAARAFQQPAGACVSGELVKVSRPLSGKWGSTREESVVRESLCSPVRPVPHSRGSGRKRQRGKHAWQLLADAAVADET